jgi:inorganic pyrophosphatase
MEDLDSSVFSNLGASLMEETDPEFTVDVFIEIAKNSHIKYEYDKEKKALICDRILHTPFNYQFNYGFIPDTLSEDGDPIDVVVIMEDELIPGSYINCRLLGYLETKDESGIDPKLIMCPSRKVDPTYSSYRNISDINPSLREKIKYFFSHYKDLENKHVVIGTFRGKYDAIQIYQESVERLNLQPLTPTTPITSVTTIASTTPVISVTTIAPTTPSDNSLTYSTSKTSSNNVSVETIVITDNFPCIINSQPKNTINEPLIEKNKSIGYGCCGCLQTPE